MSTRSDVDADRALIEAVIASDPGGIDRFVRKYVRFIYCSACRDACLGRYDAEDVTRRVFVRLLEVVNNEALSFARARLRPAHDLLPPNDPEADTLLAEVRTLIVHSYEKLPPRQQKAVASRYQYAMGQQSIAAIFGLSQANAAQRVSRGTRALRDGLSSKLGERPWLLA